MFDSVASESSKGRPNAIRWTAKMEKDMPGKSVKVLIADDSEQVCKAIRVLLSQEPGIEVLGEARTLAETLKMASRLQPDITLLDLHIPFGDEAIEQVNVKAQLLSCSDRVIGISIWNDDETKALAELYGATNLIDKINVGCELIPILLSKSTTAA